MKHPSLRLYAVNILSQFTPTTRLFNLRSKCYRWAGVEVDRARINSRVFIQHPNVSIGSNTWIGARTEIVATQDSHVTIGDNCDLAQDVYISCGTHEIGSHGHRAGTDTSKPVSIGSGTWVGLRATFLAGSSVGNGCVVAAGALVRDNFPDNVLIAGIPARIMRHLE